MAITYQTAAAAIKEMQMHEVITLYPCPTCDALLEPYDLSMMDELSLQEWRISGMCQQCQDDVFTCKDGCCD
jgi:hypothetical protein